MSWHYLQGERESSGECWPDGIPWPDAKLIPTPEPCCSPGNGTASYPDSQSGMTFEPLTVSHLEVELTSYREASLAKTLAALEEDWELSKGRARDFGERLSESLASVDLVSSFWKTPPCYGPAVCMPSSERLPASGMMSAGLVWGLATSAPRTEETVYGSWPTPTTTTGNEASPSMQKWPAHRKMFATIAAHTYGSNQGGAAGRLGQQRESFESELGIGYPVSLILREWLMGWPIGWTELEPLETDKFRAWLDSHGRF